jgi:uncharacterized protein (DUF1330 family)
MPAYVIVEVEIHNPVEYEEYKKLTPASIAAFDGRFIVRGANQNALKEIGSHNELWFWNFLLLKERRNGGIQ